MLCILTKFRCELVTNFNPIIEVKLDKPTEFLYCFNFNNVSNQFILIMS